MMASAPRMNQEIGQVDAAGRVTMGLWLYQYLLEQGRNPYPVPTAITVGASPFTHINATGFDEDVAISGGTVSLVQFGRAGTYYAVGAGMVRLSPGDTVRVTYSVLPTMTSIPR